MQSYKIKLSTEIEIRGFTAKATISLQTDATNIDDKIVVKMADALARSTLWEDANRQIAIDASKGGGTTKDVVFTITEQKDSVSLLIEHDSNALSASKFFSKNSDEIIRTLLTEDAQAKPISISQKFYNKAQCNCLNCLRERAVPHSQLKTLEEHAVQWVIEAIERRAQHEGKSLDKDTIIALQPAAAGTLNLISQSYGLANLASMLDKDEVPSLMPKIISEQIETAMPNIALTALIHLIAVGVTSTDQVIHEEQKPLLFAITNALFQQYADYQAGKLDEDAYEIIPVDEIEEYCRTTYAVKSMRDFLENVPQF